MDGNTWARLCVGVVAAVAVATVATPLAIRAAQRFAFYDLPAGYKGHARPTPYLGGLAVMFAFALALLAGSADAGHSLPLLGGVLVLAVVGTVDDRRNLSPGLRVLVELALGVLLSAAHLGWHLNGGAALDAAATAVWVVAVVNAFNLFDNMDGAASTMACVVAAGAGGLAVVTGDAWVAAGCAALVGACLGFLPFNLSSPAKIFLGDGGSMPLGFAVAILVAGAARSAEPSTLGLLVGLLLVGIPLLDTSLVVVSRRRRGVSILTGGRDHLTHRTRQRMGTPRRVALALGSTQVLVSGVVIVASRDSPSALVYIVLAFVVACAVSIAALEDALAASTATGARRSPADTHRPRGHEAERRPPGRVASSRVPDLCLTVLGLGAGLSPLFSAYYNVGRWVPIGLVVTVAAAMAIIARPPRFTLPGTLCALGLAGLGLWSLISSGWAQGVEQAVLQANLYLSYAAFALLALVLLRERRHLFVLLAAAAAGITIVAFSVLVRMLVDPAPIFLAGRINAPLGYINGEGAAFAMGAWLTLALAERREAVAAGAGMAATVAMALLALSSQSRGAAIATLVTGLLALVFIPGFRRRFMALAVIAAAVAAALSSVLAIYREGSAHHLQMSTVSHAAVVILAVSLAAGVVWGLLTGAAAAIDARGVSERRWLRRAVTVAAVVLIAVPSAVALTQAGTISTTVSRQWHDFTHLAGKSASTPGGVQTRLLSGGGNRFDYWRVAWHLFLDHPVAGVGAGNFTPYYFRLRDTNEVIENPHSLEMQTLSELGIVGALLLGVFLTGVGIGAVWLRAAAKEARAARTLLVAGSGVFSVWLVNTSGDWMHLLPGLTATALCGAIVVCRAGAAAHGDPGLARGPRPMLIGAGAAAFVLALTGASLLRTGLANLYLNQARTAIAARPAAAISDAQRSLSLDGANLDAYYLKAAGQARFDNAGGARATLQLARDQDPGSFVTYVLLGDLEARLGHLRLARAYYRQALSLDPRERALKLLVAHPAYRAGAR